VFLLKLHIKKKLEPVLLLNNVLCSSVNFFKLSIIGFFTSYFIVLWTTATAAALAAINQASTEGIHNRNDEEAQDDSNKH